MRSKQAGMVSLGALALGLIGPVSALADDQLRAELAELRAEVAELRNDLPASQRQDNAFPLTAGHDGSFFLASEDNKFRMNIGGQVQLRYYLNLRNDPDEGYDSTSSFQHRRTRLTFSGHVGDPRFTYRVQTEVRRQDGRGAIADLYVGYKINDQLSLQVGRMKAPFWKEDLHSSGRQLAVERSYVNNLFAQGRSTGIQLAYRPMDDLRVNGMVHNGFDAGLSDFNTGVDGNAARIALTGRAEYKIMGDWGQYRHFAGYTDDPMGLFIGGAAHWEQNRTTQWDDEKDFFSWTADASWYMENLSVFAAVVGRHATRTENDAPKFDDYGFLAQAGYTINDTFQPFVRYEHIRPDNDRNAHNVDLVTAGLNWFIRGHNAKLTTDVVWALDSLSGFAGGSGGLGLLTDAPGEKNQVVWRTQFQLLF
ncbi:porin [Phycisphaerales bacterium AB-hyl4]|uniref:Porin n=1 Tax=Natronomicrosphaera hydrolytica TaxID=3242702 RepID=A0ABV4U8K6_9BACT